MTVSGLTITRAWRQQGHRQDRMTQKTLSAFRSDGRGLFRFRTATCCRRARISVWSAARSAKISMILCMPERVSGGDAKFQGFCDRWNKWEGQAQDHLHGATRVDAAPYRTAETNRFSSAWPAAHDSTAGSGALRQMAKDVPTKAGHRNVRNEPVSGDWSTRHNAAESCLSHAFRVSRNFPLLVFSSQA